MLSLPDFREKQIIFIESYQAKNIKFKNDNLTVEEDGKITNQVSCFKIFCVFIIGEISITSVLINKLLKYGISIFLMNQNFKVYTTIGCQTEGNYLLRRRQYSCDKQLGISSHIVRNKISNQMSLLKSIRNKNDENKKSIESLDALLEKIEAVKDNQELLGIEGNASKIFFQDYFEAIKWYRRTPRTKHDIPNLLLDIGYTFLFNFIDCHLRLYGFDTYIGFYHKLYFQRKSLVCDLVEPFRCIIDRALRKAYNLKQIDESDFEFRMNQFVLNYKYGRKYTKIFLEAIMEEKEEVFTYIQSFYRAFMREGRDLPEYLIK